MTRSKPWCAAVQLARSALKAWFRESAEDRARNAQNDGVGAQRPARGIIRTITTKLDGILASLPEK